ncbi:MAG: energy-coupling factor transporter transmembrane component T family protein [Nitrososphaeria archaeon]
MIELDPRTKVISFTIIFTSAFIINDLITMATATVAVLITCLLCNGREEIFGRLKVMAPIFVVAFLLWTFLHQFSLFHTYSDSSASFQIGAFMTTRLFLIVLTSLAFVSLITPTELVNALASFRLPYKIVFTLGLALRHISTISEEYAAIKEGQTSRGLELDKGFLVKRIKNYNTVMIPLLVRSIENAERLVLAMELKAFSLENRRRYSIGKLKTIDYTIIFTMTAVLAIIIAKNLLG